MVEVPCGYQGRLACGLAIAAQLVHNDGHPVPLCELRSTEPMRKSLETRQLLLDTALKMLHKSGPSASVGHILLKEVVREAGLTLGAAYPHWSTQEAFRHDLAIAALRWRDRATVERTYEQIRHVFEAKGPLSEVLRLGSEGNLQSFPEDIAFLTSMALRASAIGHEDLVAASHTRHLESMAAFIELYTVVLATYGRRMRVPFTVDHLAALFAALMEGFALQTVAGEEHPRIALSASDPEIGGNPNVGRDWTLLAIAVATLVERMTEPS